jgi:4-amino-4-deoxy-L-arabinose transferase-like glycosyltransferase
VTHARLALCAAALVALVWLLFFWDLGAVPLYSVGEPRESVQVLEAFDHGKWILPLRNGTELPSKPPLFHWMASGVALMLGRVDELVVRLPSALAAAATVLAVAWYCARRWDAAAGVLAGFMLAANVGWIRLARVARTDMVLTACITAACLAFERAVATPLPPPPLMLWAFYVGMGLAGLAKGPIGLALPITIALAYLALTRQLRRVRELNVVRGLAVSIGIPALWYLAASAIGGMDFVRKQILRENVIRALGTGTSRVNEAHPIYYYTYEFAGGFAPWSIFLVPLAVYLVQYRRRPEIVRPYLYPLVWFITVLTVFTLAAGKRSSYILAAYPAAAIMLGAWWSALAREGAALPAALRRIVQIVVGVAAAATALVVLILLLHGIGLDPLEWIRPLLHRKDQLNLPLVRTALSEHWPSAAGWAVLTALAAWMLLTGARDSRWPRVFAGLVIYVAATAAVINHAFMPGLAADRTYKPFMAEVRRVAGDSDRLFFYGRFDYGAIFYARRHIPVLDGRLPDGAGPAWVLFTEREWDGLPEAERARGEILARSSGSGPEARARLLLVRYSPPG